MKRFISVFLLIALLSSFTPAGLADDTMFCRFCGKQINVDSIFCQFCGKNLTESQSAVNNTTQNSTAGIDYDKLAEKVLRIENYQDGELISRGSGVVAFASNIVVTNYHVIEAFNEEIIVTADDGASAEVKNILICDEGKDLAILELEVPTSITPFVIGDSENLKRGDPVLAIGSPLGLLNTVSDGIVSGIGNNGITNDIQITAPISHGSSGGALLNKNGELIGITYAGSENGENIGYAIPAFEVEQLWNEYQAVPVAKRDIFAKGINLLRAGKYVEAKDYFTTYGYDQMVNECKYQLAIKYIIDEEYTKAVSLLSELANKNYKDSGEMKKSINYLQAYELAFSDTASKIIEGIKRLKEFEKENYPDAKQDISDAIDYLFIFGQTKYEGGNYAAATLAFRELCDYKEYSDYANLYYILSTVRRSKYVSISDSEYALMLANLDLADVREAMMCNDGIACKFLDGKWRTENGYKYDYSAKESQYDWTIPCISYNAGYVKIEDGIQYFQEKDSDEWKVDRKIKVINKDTIEIFCYADNKTYTLYRK